MVDYGIVDSAYLVCDRSVNANHEDLVVAFVGGERLVKQLYQKRGKVHFVAGNAAYPALDVSEGVGSAFGCVFHSRTDNVLLQVCVQESDGLAISHIQPSPKSRRQARQ